MAGSENGRTAGCRSDRRKPAGAIRIAAVLLAGVLSACAGRPEGILIPTQGDFQGTSRVRMLVATTRATDAANRSIMFSGARADEVSYADITVSIPPESARETGEVQWPDELPADPQQSFTTVSARQFGQGEAMAAFREFPASVRSKHVLVFVHGYNNEFEDAVYRFAQIVHDSDAPVLPVLFTWPSQGSFTGYAYDRESATFSRDALEDLLTWLAQQGDVDQVSVLAHSMGNWLTLEALRQMTIRNGRVAPKITDVILAAPDVDVDVFRTQVAAIGENRPAFTLIVSRGDRALALSRRVWGSTQRLGSIDPLAAPYRAQLTEAGIDVVDITGVKSQDRLRHTTFAQSPVVVAAIGNQLARGQSLSTVEAGLGEQIATLTTTAGASVGRAAGLLVTAPLAVVNPGEREQFGDRVNQLGTDIDAVAGSVVPRGAPSSPSRRQVLVRPLDDAN